MKRPRIAKRRDRKTSKRDLAERGYEPHRYSTAYYAWKRARMKGAGHAVAAEAQIGQR